MSNIRQDPSSLDAADAGQRQQNAPSTLRVLAPKPPPASASQSLAIRSATPQPSGTSAPKRRSPTPCVVCYRIGCQLPTHSAFSNQSSSASSSPLDKPNPAKTKISSTFTSSYAYRLAQQYVDTNIAASKIDPFYDLPVGEGRNTVEMHRLFHRWFTVDAQNMLKITAPPEIGGNMTISPFFLPAMQDPLLCLSILAVSASRSLHLPQTNDITSLTLVGQAMQQMRERVRSDPNHISDATISAAVFLWGLEIMAGNVDAIASHSRGMYAFVAARGGLHELGLVGAIAHLIRIGDALTSFYLPIPCHYRDTPEPEPLSNPPPARYGSYWDSQNTTTEMDIHKDVIVSCQETCRVMERWEHAESEGMLGAEYVRLGQWMLVLYQKGSVLRAKYHRQGSVDECISLAIGLLQYHCFSGFEELLTLARTNVERLVIAIKTCGGPTFWQQDPDLLTWLLVMVVLVPAEDKERAGCLRFLSQVISSSFGQEGVLKSEWRKELKHCLHGFIWCEFRLDGDLQGICEEVEAELEQGVIEVDGTDEED